MCPTLILQTEDISSDIQINHHEVRLNQNSFAETLTRPLARQTEAKEVARANAEQPFGVSYEAHVVRDQDNRLQSKLGTRHNTGLQCGWLYNARDYECHWMSRDQTHSSGSILP